LDLTGGQDRLGIPDPAHQPGRHRGCQRRLARRRGERGLADLMGDPAVLLVDEPTAALDQERSEAIVRLLRQVTDKFGLATVMVTHDSGLVPLTDTVASMLDGKLSALQPVSLALP
jgi:ABC-type lipoprotein export system ATPase subunit